MYIPNEVLKRQLFSFSHGEIGRSFIDTDIQFNYHNDIYEYMLPWSASESESNDSDSDADQGDVVIESNPDICYICKADINNYYKKTVFEKKKNLFNFYTRNILVDDIIEQIYLPSNNTVFIYKNRNTTLLKQIIDCSIEYSSQYVFIHLCTSCMKKGFNDWKQKNTKSDIRKRSELPHLRCHGNEFIYNLMLLNKKPMLNYKIDTFELKQVPKLYYCDYYISLGYLYNISQPVAKNETREHVLLMKRISEKLLDNFSLVFSYKDYTLPDSLIFR